MFKVNFLNCVSAAALLCASITLVGCDNSGRIAIQGKVNFDGEPVEYGYVEFNPLPGTEGPNGGADIKDGAYQVDAIRGLFEGSYRVEVKSWKRQGKFSIDPVTGEKTEGGNLKQVLPGKYNKESELTIDIKSGKNEYNFDLEP